MRFPPLSTVRGRETPRRRAAVAAAVLGLAPLASTALAAAPASAHGSMGAPVSRVAQCSAEGPESPASAACRAAVAAGGTQALYDGNGVRIGDAAGRHRELIPDSRLCGAGTEEFTGLDLARAGGPATRVHSGPYTFRYRVTAPHRGTFTVYATRSGYDPARPLAWSDLDLEHPVATAADPVASGGFYAFTGTLPARTGRQVLYAVWQRPDSPEAFSSCSDVDFGGTPAGTPAPHTEAAAPAPAPTVPTERQITAAQRRSTVTHPHEEPERATPAPVATTAQAVNTAPSVVTSVRLADTGTSPRTSYAAIGGAAVLALGSAALFLSVGQRATGRAGR